jgi:hypothetical protein
VPESSAWNTRRDVSTPILFSPDNVRGVLANLPSVAALLPDPAEEGVDSEAFPGVLRKTEREVYRWLANTHYEHLAEVVPVLERVHAAGCSFGSLLTTRDREQFVSHRDEILVADDLLRRGFGVSTIPLAATVTPDLRVTGDGIDVAVEVYSPRELLAVDAWVHEVTDLLSYTDVRASYRSSVETRVDQTIPPHGDPVPDPWATAEMLSRTREEVSARIAHDVEAALRKLAPLTESYAHPDTPLVTTVEVYDVERAPEAGSARHGTVSYPGFSGYSPSGVFRKTVEKALNKASKRQTQGVPAAARVLAVYLMGTQVADDLTHPVHHREAVAVAEGIEPLDYGLDAMAFVVRVLPQGLASILTVADDTNLTRETVEAMFSQAP